ncbi:hypothetical protein CDIK_2102 [Cucumispora dikerogammari]|nr:hypothetical protein CDIK_2102 [Cucumispora dikerogammari]
MTNGNHPTFYENEIINNKNNSINNNIMADVLILDYNNKRDENKIGKIKKEKNKEDNFETSTLKHSYVTNTVMPETNINNKTRIILLLLFISLCLLLYCLSDIHKSPHRLKLEAEKTLPNLKYYTVYCGTITAIQGCLYFSFVLFNYFLCYFNYNEHNYFFFIKRIINNINIITHKITLSINLFITLTFWPIYFINRKLIMGSEAIKNPAYFIDTILHISPVCISGLISYLYYLHHYNRQENSGTKKKRFVSKLIIIWCINVVYLLIALYVKYKDRKWPYPFLRNINGFGIGGLLIGLVAVQGGILWCLSYR